MEYRALPVLRRLVLAGVLGGLLVTDGFAQDLRGAIVTGPATMNWRGVYGGAQWNYNSGDVDFGSATQPLTDFILRNSDILSDVSGWTTLQSGSTTSNGFGGFLGYNWQWDDVVIGVEANYSRTSITKSASDGLSRQITTQENAPPDFTYIYGIAVSGNSVVTLTDLMTFRARAGWAVGNLLPYGFVGLAVARANISTTATVSGDRTELYTPPAGCDPLNPPPLGCSPVSFGPFPLILPGPQGIERKGVFAYGPSIGLGFDWALTPNVFLRGEWELTQIKDIEGVDLRMNTGRVALGLKF